MIKKVILIKTAIDNCYHTKDTQKCTLTNTASYDAVNGTPAADEGYTSTPCGVCLLSIL